MSIDLSQFYEVFFEESFEGLDIMEHELLALKPGSKDSETLNTIFRAAHSIKGGSGTFGFNVVADFTHDLETLLDQIREGTRTIESEHIDLFLKTVDCLRDMLTALKNSEEPDTTVANDISRQILAILNDEGTPSSNNTAQSGPVEPPSQSQDHSNGGSKRWHISFKPQSHLFKTGNEPIFMFQELADLGQMSIEADFSHLPPFHDLQPDDSYLYWQIELIADCEKEKIEEIFEWVLDDCELEIRCDDADLPDSQADDITDEKPVEVEAAPEPPIPEPIIEVAPPVAERLADTNAVSESGAAQSKKAESTSIRVSIEKVDSLINMVGELVITQAMLSQYSEGEFTENRRMLMLEGLSQLAHNTRELQESVMQIRMLPISHVFNRFPRLVRDISQKLGKKVELKLLGETTELDKTVMEKISDPMVHLIRNSLDHGLEKPDERLAAGKEETGTVTLNAYHQGGNIVIKIIDDGKGINPEVVKQKALDKGLIQSSDELTEQEIIDLIFLPGFSTATEVSDLSGRGVGMDVVRRNIQELNGTVEVSSERDVGSTFTIRLPLTLAILDGQLVTVGKNTYIIPLVNIIESIQMTPDQLNNVGGDMELFRQRDEYIPILRLYQIFNHDGAVENLTQGILVIVDSEYGHVGLLVDDLLAQQQVVIKSLEANYQRVEGISGATILGDGTISLIIDIGGVISLAGLKKHQRKQTRHMAVS